MLSAQQNLSEQLRTQLEGKTTFPEVMSVVDPFYQNLPADIRNNGGDGLLKYKHWKRWQWYMERRLGPHGEFVNIPKHNLGILEDNVTSHPDSRFLPIEGEWESLGMIQSSYSADTNNYYPIGHTGISYANGTGRVDRIAFHPTDPDIIYIGTPCGGLWRTTDAGASWEPLTDTLASLGISGIAVTPSNPDEIYILTGIGDDGIGSFFSYMQIAPSLGVMKSEDGGTTWAFTDTFPIPSNTVFASYDLVQSEGNEDLLLAATTEGIFRTLNGGDTWTKVKTGLHYDLQFKPGSSSVVYAADANNVYYSTNSGLTWSTSTLNIAPLASNVRVALAVTPANSNIVYAYFGNSSSSSGLFSGVYLSTNSGVNFTRRKNTPNILGYSIYGNDNNSQANYDLCIAVHPNNVNKVSLGGINIWRSVDSCASFTNLTGWFENQGALEYVHCDQHAMAFNPLNNKLYFCNDGGIWVSDNFGDNCTNISKGLVLNQFYHLSQSDSRSYRLAGGLQDNGVKCRATGVEDFTHMFGADGFSTSFVAGDHDEFYATINDGLLRFKYSTGDTFWLGSPTSMFFQEILAHPYDTNLVFLGAESIWRSTNKGISWTNVGGKGSWALAIAPSRPQRMYAAGGSNWWLDGNGGAYTSTNSGLSWTLMSNKPGFPEIFSVVTDIAVDPLDSLTVYVTMGGLVNNKKVYRSTNGGNNWSNITYNLPNVAVLSVITSPNDIFVGTDISVYHLAKGGTTWTDIGSNIPHAGITDLVYDHNSGTLTASTMGRGVWQRNVCIEDITLTYPLEGALHYSCDDQFLSSSTIPGNDLDSVSFRANGIIKLLPGFQVGSGAYFKAKMEACDDGNVPLQIVPPVNVSPMTTKPENAIVRKTQEE